MRHDCVRTGQPPWLPQKIGGPEPIGRDAAAHGQVARWCRPRESKSRGVEHQQAAAWQPPTGSVLEPACPETTGDTPRSLTSRPTTSEPGEESWDFDGSGLTSARNRTRRSPMLTHETSPVSGASVVGMTSRVGQGQRCLPADVLGISTALSQEDRLRPKGRLRQQLAGNSTAESQSRRRQQDPSNGCFAESSMAPTRSTEARVRRDASHARPPPISGQEPSP
jgi:hypothetical protein